MEQRATTPTVVWLLTCLLIVLPWDSDSEFVLHTQRTRGSGAGDEGQRAGGLGGMGGQARAPEGRPTERQLRVVPLWVPAAPAHHCCMVLVS